MARGGIEKLKVNNLTTKKPGRLSDGGNLYLETNRGKNGDLVRSWIFRFKLNGGRERDMGLGSLDSIGLAKARELAAQYRELVTLGIDPIENRNETLAARRAEEALKAEPPTTLDDCWKDYVNAHRASWRNPKHAQQWVNSWKTYVSPIIGKLPVNMINKDHVLKVIKPIWHEKTDTAKRVRGRIETVLDFASVMEKRAGDNPARWQGYLENVLASPEKIAPVEHHAALDYKNIGEFMAQLRQREGVGALRVGIHHPRLRPHLRNIGRGLRRSSTWTRRYGSFRLTGSRRAKSIGCRCRRQQWQCCTRSAKARKRSAARLLRASLYSRMTGRAASYPKIPCPRF